MLMSNSEDEDSETLFASPHPEIVEEEALLNYHKDGKINGKVSGRLKNLLTPSSNYPKTVFFILGTEFCERFNYFGMRTVLVIYMTNWLGLAYHSAVAWYHGFNMLAYFSPLLGAIIADGYLGRYKTILYLSLIYALGTIILSLTAFPPPEMYGPVIGLLLISLGTGGIKPCVSAFGGDQFSSQQGKERQSFFSAFYFMINLGAMLATIITPILRGDVHCIEDSCYPLAFGLPALLMIIALGIFVMGETHYKHIPPTGNLFGRVVKCVLHGIQLRIQHGKNQETDGHWLNYTIKSYEESFVADVKALLKILWLFLPLPLFWALFNQQGSRWTLQAVEMNGDLGALGRVKPDQLQVLNPVFILMMIPLFERLVYPCLDKLRIPNMPLQRMCVGMMLCGIAFVLAGCLQLKMEGMSESSLNGQSGVTFMNAIDCTVQLRSPFYTAYILPYKKSSYVRLNPGKLALTLTCADSASSQPSGSRLQLPSLNPIHVQLSVKANVAYRVVIHKDNRTASLMTASQFEDERNKDKEGKAKFSLLSYAGLPTNTTAGLYLGHSSKVPVVKVNISESVPSKFTSIEPGQYSVCVFTHSSPRTACIGIKLTLLMGIGSVQTVVLHTGKSNMTDTYKRSSIQFTSLEESQISMLWMVPQYTVITTGEILFSITGLAFAYSQAPASMKSILQAAWLLTTAVGDLIVVLVAEAQLMPSQSAEFFLFAGLMGLDTLLFSYMALKYKSSFPSSSALEFDIDTVLLIDDKDTNESPSYHLHSISTNKQD